MLEPPLGHIEFEFPRTRGIGEREQRLSALDGPVQQLLFDFPGDDLASGGRDDFQLLLLLPKEDELPFEVALPLFELE